MEGPLNPRGTPTEEAPFVWASSAALERIERGLGGTRAAFATATYVALCRLANERGSPMLREHVSLIGHLSGLGNTTTRAMLRELERLELVSITLNKLPHCKGNDASSYVIRGTSSVMRGTSNAGRGTSSAAGASNGDGCLKKGREVKQETLSPLIAGVGPAEIYAAYPHKVGKPDAIRAIEKALKTIDGAKLLAITEAYATACPPGTPYTPYPATWFNGQRYLDDPSTWVRQGQRQTAPAITPAAGSAEFCDGWENKSASEMTPEEQKRAARLCAQ